MPDVIGFAAAASAAIQPGVPEGDVCLAAPTTSSGRSLLPMQPAGPRPHIPNPFQIQRLPLRIHPRPGTSPRLGANVVSLVSLLRTRPEGQDEWPSRPRPLRLHYSRGLRSPPTNRLALVCITLTAVLGTSVSPRSHHPHRPLPLALPLAPSAHLSLALSVARRFLRHPNPLDRAIVALSTSSAFGLEPRFSSSSEAFTTLVSWPDGRGSSLSFGATFAACNT